jgi:hypothetical protein
MLHVRVVKKAVNKAFYSPSQKIGFCRRFAEALSLSTTTHTAKTVCRLKLLADDSISIKN